MTDVRVCGPNLRDQSKGYLHVHLHDCGDLKHYGPGSKYGGDLDGMNEMLIKDATKLKVLFEVYGDQMDESPETPTEVYMNDLWFAPCCDGISYGEQP